MARWDEVERQALVDALRAASPDAPTLCEGWQARHLATHLFLRRHEPWRAFREQEGSRFAELAEQAADPSVYADVVERFAAPPAPLSPLALTDGPLGMVTNFAEYVIHHEDLRRGAGAAPPRSLPAEESDALFDALGLMARAGLRSVDVGVVLVVPGGRRRVVRKRPDSVAVVGAPVELALAVSGRRGAADVEVVGEPEAVAAFEAALA